MAQVSPGAEFQFMAHLPQWGLDWSLPDAEWSGNLPSITPDPTSTVWGAVFSIPDDEFDQLAKAEKKEGRVDVVVEAMDRTGKRHQVPTHAFPTIGASDGTPSTEYVAIMLEGSQHWGLPAGWIAGLQEHLGNPC